MLRRFSTPPVRSADALVDRVLADLREHPIAVEAGRQAIERRRAEREHHAGEIERLRSEQGEQLAAAQAEIDVAEVAVRAARTAFDAAQRQAVEARSRRWSLSITGDRAIGQHEAALLDLAEPAIDAFIREMRDLAIEERSTVIVHSSASRVVPPGFPEAPEYVQQSNAASAAERAAAISAAIEAATALKRRADQSTAEADLATLRDSIPPIVDESVSFFGPKATEPSTRKHADDEGSTIFTFGGM